MVGFRATLTATEAAAAATPAKARDKSAAEVELARKRPASPVPADEPPAKTPKSPEAVIEGPEADFGYGLGGPWRRFRGWWSRCPRR